MVVREVVGPFFLRLEPLEIIMATLAAAGGRLVIAMQARAFERYRVELVAALADGTGLLGRGRPNESGHSADALQEGG